jgi:hypothetical protein
MKILHWFLIAGFACALFLIGCATTQHPDEVAGHPRFTELCAKCHTLDRVEQAHQAMTSKQMRIIVERMAKKPGSGIELTDIDDIVREIY